MSDKRSIDRIRDEIVAALNHPEADEGLYFRNLFHLHEEDERPAVEGQPGDIRAALASLMDDGVVVADETGPEPIFILAKH